MFFAAWLGKYGGVAHLVDDALVMTNSLLAKPWHIEIVDLPIEDGDFPYLTLSLPGGIQ